MNGLQVRRLASQRSKGIYVLVIEAHGKTQVGRLGLKHFDGIYLYVGSTMGPGGFKRLERHRAVASGRNKTQHWHIDYLLALGELKGIFTSETRPPSQKQNLECALAHELAKRTEPAIEGFGASDCRCLTHLFKSVSDCDTIISEALRALGLKTEALKL